MTAVCHVGQDISKKDCSWYFCSKRKKEHLQVCFIAVLVVGYILLMISARELMSLGPDKLERATSANFVNAKLVPGRDKEAFYCDQSDDRFGHQA
jgi:hypothetical protein